MVSFCLLSFAQERWNVIVKAWCSAPLRAPLTDTTAGAEQEALLTGGDVKKVSCLSSSIGRQ